MAQWHGEQQRKITLHRACVNVFACAVLCTVDPWHVCDCVITIYLKRTMKCETRTERGFTELLYKCAFSAISRLISGWIRVYSIRVFITKKPFFCECVCDFPIFSPMDRERKVCASVCEFALSKLNSQAMFLFAAACCCIRMKD